MIYTIYANLYEVLQEALFQNIKTELEDSRKNYSSEGIPENIFQKIPVISPSHAVDSFLSRALTDRSPSASNPGVEFIHLFKWLQLIVGSTLRPEYQGSTLVWQIWELLKDSTFTSNLDCIKAKRLLNYIKSTGDKQVDDYQLLDFCYRLSDLYSKYASYRTDWLLMWKEGKTGEKYCIDSRLMQLIKEQKTTPPDYFWQEQLWHEIAATGGDNTGEIEGLEELYKTLATETLPPDMVGKTFHLFMPFSLPPIVLPIIRAFERKKDTHLRLYILNPSSEYWFESVPLELSDWKEKAADPAYQYLRINASSTRAMIDRLYRFLDTDETSKRATAPEDVFRVEYQDEVENKLSSNIPPVGRQQVTDLNKIQVSATTDIQLYYYKSENDTYLHRFQNSIALLDSSLLPSKSPKPKENNSEEVFFDDESLRIFKAPSFIRELEGIVDWLHYIFKKDTTLKASDVLVVVPDIDSAAPEIECVMEESRLAWRIIGSSVIDTDLTSTAIISFCHLLNSSFNVDDFLEWLELPINQIRWDLSLSDISILKNWLDAAGFRRGISVGHLAEHGLDADDCSLDFAIERLSLGYLLNPVELQHFGDVLPIFGKENGGFDSVSNEGGRLLKSLISISEQIEICRQELSDIEHNETGCPNRWGKTFGKWINRLFVLPKNSANLISFRSTLSRTIKAMDTVMSDRVHVPFAILLQALEQNLRVNKNYHDQRGAITFASITAIRGLPFKAVIAAGFDDNSEFPGRTYCEEFDLMGIDELKRKNDRDSRADNWAKFLDVTLAARKYLILSYTIGTDDKKEGNPSPVIENFKTYFLSNALTVDTTGGIAKEIWDSITVTIPLTSFSVNNFKKTFSKNWISPSFRMHEAVKQAMSVRLKGEKRNKTPFVDCIPDSFLEAENSAHKNFIVKDSGVDGQKKLILPAHTLIDFICDAEKYAGKRFGLNIDDRQNRPGNKFYNKENSNEQEGLGWLPPPKPLATIRLNKIYGYLENSASPDEIKKWGSLNPIYGMKSIRGLMAENEIDPIVKNWENLFSKAPKELDEINLTITNPLSKETGIKEIILTDSANSLHKPAGGQERLVLFAGSNSAKKKAILRLIIWHAQKKANFGISLISKNQTEDFILDPKLDTVGLVKVLCEIFVIDRKFGLSIVSNENRLLWRSFNPSNFSEINNASHEFNSSLEEFSKTNTKALEEKVENLRKNAETLLAKLRNYYLPGKTND